KQKLVLAHVSQDCTRLRFPLRTARPTDVHSITRQPSLANFCERRCLEQNSMKTTRRSAWHHHASTPMTTRSIRQTSLKKSAAVLIAFTFCSLVASTYGSI